eukprot:1939603-Pleurochrysis_carterae.AAC.4
MACESLGLMTSRGRFERAFSSAACCAAVRGKCFSASHARSSGRLSLCKWRGRWWTLLAALIESAWMPSMSVTSQPGPPPSAVRRHLLGSSLRGVAPCPL